MATALHPGRWQLKEEQNGDGTLVIFTGRVRQAHVEENLVIGRQLVDLVDGLVQGNVYLDFGNVAYLNCVELGKLVGLWKKLTADGKRLALYNVRPHVYDVFEISQLTKLMAISKDGPRPASGP